MEKAKSGCESLVDMHHAEVDPKVLPFRFLCGGCEVGMEHEAGQQKSSGRRAAHSKHRSSKAAMSAQG